MIKRFILNSLFLAFFSLNSFAASSYKRQGVYADVAVGLNNVINSKEINSISTDNSLLEPAIKIGFGYRFVIKEHFSLAFDAVAQFNINNNNLFQATSTDDYATVDGVASFLGVNIKPGVAFFDSTFHLYGIAGFGAILASSKVASDASFGLISNLAVAYGFGSSIAFKRYAEFFIEFYAASAVVNLNYLTSSGLTGMSSDLSFYSVMAGLRFVV